jgi:phosphoglucosamine mutase
VLRFGTDGVRGVAGRELTPELVLALGRAAAQVLASPGGGFLVGRDTRLSGPMLQAAFSAGVASEGVNVVDLGVLPTPGVAAVASARRVPAAMISASHNVFSDNGIKLFSAGGRKLTDDQEAAIEAMLGESLGSPAGRDGLALGRLTGDPAGAGAYSDMVVEALEGRRLDGVRVVIDCANGAAVTTATSIFSAAGVDLVDVLAAAPDGTNINADCGSTNPRALGASVVRHGADAGLAFDGDADRVIAVDDRGEVVDGDRLLALFATDLHERRRLAGDSVVVTVMTNLGFHRAMAAAGISVEQTPVGDRYVLEALESHGWSLGGEQSGHIVFRDLATTGDGVLTGLLLLDLLARREEPLSKLAAAAMVRLPQVLRNVQVADHRGLESAASVWDEVRELEEELGGDGRVLIRPSGTEPLVRVMVEARTSAVAEAAADRLAASVVAALGAPTAPQ